VCTCFQIALVLVLPPHISCELGEQICGLAPMVLCCIGNQPDTVEFWDDLSASDVCIVFCLDFSIYLFDLPLSICRTSIMVSVVNLISSYLVRTNLTSFKVVDQAGP
jgi:hypothetical protein